MLQEDSVIVASLQSDDEQMFEKLFRHYYSGLCNYVNGILNDKDDSEDVVQQAMINIWEKRKQLQITVSLKSYLYRSVHNAALNRIRQAKVRTIYADAQTESETGIDSTSGKIAANELQTQLQDAINMLPDQCRTVFKLSRFSEMKYAEIADHLGISVKTVENHMGKALRLLRVQLKDYLVWLCMFITKYFES